MQRAYKCLLQQEFSDGNYKLIPIRDEDKYAIMQWRNEQIDILRQREPLTKEKQEAYFKNVVDKLFEHEKPEQVLFSVLENDVLIGYGGLVHIDWENRSAEVSFLTATERSKEQFINDWKEYLKILKKIADVHLNFLKIFTYAYDIRPHLYQALAESNFVEETRLKDEVSINGKSYDVVIHACFFDDITFRMADKNDVKLYFDWANDSEVRKNSFNGDPIEFEKHSEWFFSKLSSGKCSFYLFSDKNNSPIGQVRVENTGDETIIGTSVDKNFRGKSMSGKMLVKSTSDYLNRHPDEKIIAYIKQENIASFKSFISAGFVEERMTNINGIKSYKFIKELK